MFGVEIAGPVIHVEFLKKNAGFVARRYSVLVHKKEKHVSHEKL